MKNERLARTEPDPDVPPATTDLEHFQELNIRIVRLLEGEPEIYPGETYSLIEETDKIASERIRGLHKP